LPTSTTAPNTTISKAPANTTSSVSGANKTAPIKKMVTGRTRSYTTLSAPSGLGMKKVTDKPSYRAAAANTIIEENKSDDLDTNEGIGMAEAMFAGVAKNREGFSDEVKKAETPNPKKTLNTSRIQPSKRVGTFGTVTTGRTTKAVASTPKPADETTATDKPKKGFFGFANPFSK